MIRPKILIFSGSIRSGSVNTKLVDAFVGELALLECEVTRITLADYELPLYNGDLEGSKGVPKNAEKLAQLFQAQNGIIFVGPEYNGSISPLMKNTIDWMSRVKEIKGIAALPFANKIALIASASPGAMGGISSLTHMRDLLVSLKMLVLSEQLGVGNAYTAFDDDDKLTNERQAEILSRAVKSLVEKSTLLV